MKGCESRGKVWSFRTFLVKVVVHEKNSTTWEFGKGALSELQCCGVAIGKSLEAEGEMPNVKAQMPKAKTQMTNHKYLITNTK
jgi:hypothetical protein